MYCGSSVFSHQRTRVPADRDLCEGVLRANRQEAVSWWHYLGQEEAVTAPLRTEVCVHHRVVLQDLAYSLV